MRWKQARKRDLPGIILFLLEWEWKSVALTSRLLHNGNFRLPPRYSASLFFCQEGKRVRGVLLRTPHPSRLIPPLLGEGRSELFPDPRLAEEGVHSVMGILRDVLWVERNLKIRPEVSVDCHLMMLSREEYLQRKLPSRGRLPGLLIRGARPEDLNGLFPLQKNYELEEVLVHRDHFSGQACRFTPKRLLKNQLTYLGELEGRIVGKAGTNARGLHTDQIGGVYTLKGLRNQGIAEWLMRELLASIFLEKNAVTLFVKKDNLPATALYRKLGFSVRESYRISYY